MAREKRMILCDECNRAVGEVQDDGSVKLFHRHDKSIHTTKLQMKAPAKNHNRQDKGD